MPILTQSNSYLIEKQDNDVCIIQKLDCFFWIQDFLPKQSKTNFLSIKENVLELKKILRPKFKIP